MKKTLQFSFALLLTFFAKAQTPVAYYPFNGNANDAIGTLNGTVNGAALTTDRFGNANSAYSFDGVNDVINFATIPITNTDNFTLMAWVNPALFDPANQFNKMIISLGPGNNGYNMGMGNNSGSGGGNQLGGLYNLVSWLPSGSFFSTINTWYQIAMVRENGITKFYLNADLAPNTFSSNPNSFSTAFQIGGQDFDPTHFWNGKIDEVKIYDVALTATQIQQEYASSSQIQKPGSGNAISFDGVDDRIELDNTNNNSRPVSFITTESWIKLNSASSYNGIVCNTQDNGSDEAGYYFYTNSGVSNLYFAIKTVNASAFTEISTTIPLNTLVHVAATYDGSNVNLYVNGILKATAAATGDIDWVSNNPTKYNIGAYIDDNEQYYFNGEIDEVRIWNTALTQAQIRDRMCHKITTNDALYSNLIAYYNFDESTGTTALDGTVNASNGTFIDNPTRVTSGAAIGNASTHNYVTTGLPATNLTYNGQDNLAVTLNAGTYTGEAGTHVYVVNEKPSTTPDITFTGNNNRYFGVFNANIKDPNYTAIYNYTGNPAVGVSEGDLLLFKRNDNASIWSNANAVLDINLNTLNVIGQNTEYILGFSSNPLPITLISFSGKSTENGNELIWKTTNETNFSHFEIQRSEDAKKFEKIGKVDGNNETNYQFIDWQAPPSGAGGASGGLFYRLKLIDLNGKYSYSKIIRVENETKFSFAIYPNPVIDNLNISANLKESGNYQIQILNEIGQVKINQNSYLKSGQNQISIPVSSFQKGLYFAVIQGDMGLSKVLKFLK